MKDIDYNYWEKSEQTGEDADARNPDLRVAMNQLYGNSKIDFGVIPKKTITYNDIENLESHFSPDSYSTYTSLVGNYIKLMPFRKEAYDENLELVNQLKKIAGTIAGEIFFPCRRFNGNTINQNRGFLKKISDRFDLTLQNINYFYNEIEREYPLKNCILNYNWFFNQFSNFKEYVDYCLLNDFCDDQYNVILWKDKDGLPENKEELVDFWQWSLNRLQARLKRIEVVAIKRNLFEVKLPHNLSLINNPC